MPPNSQYFNPNAYTLVVDDEILNKQKRRFSDHCKTFFRHSLSMYDEGSDEDVNTSKDIMNVFNSLVANQQQQLPLCLDEKDANYSELVKCGFNDMDDQTMIELMRIRNEERSKAHQDGMKQRCKELHKIFEQVNASQEDNADQFIHVKDFTTSYKQNIGLHSLFAGMRNLLESQIKNEKQSIYWKFDSITITESFDNTTISSKEYFKQVALMFQSFLVRVEDEQEADNNDANGNMLCWKVNPSLIKRRMRKFLNCLPNKDDLHARPTGKLTQTEIIRNVEKDCWCFW